MLLRLSIENYGLIARAEIAFARGATIFTGETGSGKTMLLGALEFALGARSDVEMVRRGAGKAIVSLGFDPEEVLRARFEADGFPLDPGEEATIVRELTDAGKSSVRVNGRAATASYVREIAGGIAEIVGQHEAQRLLSPAYQLELLDRFGGAEAADALIATATAYERATALGARLERLQGDERRALRESEDARFALDEIEAVQPHLGEDVRLTERRRYLDNVERIAGALRGAHDALSGDDGANASLGIASSALGGIAEIDETLAAMAAQAGALQSQANDLAQSLARALEDTEFDAPELETIVARLDALDRLKRKYGGSIEALLESAERARSVADDYERRDERIVEIRRELEAADRALQAAASDLTRIRQTSAERLGRRVVEEFADLALTSGRFDVTFEALERIGPAGAERIDFAFAASAGEPLRPLTRVASGGELSRLLLATIVALAEARERVALVFDEIDAGIGGATATAVGARLGALARDTQVVCVTHLAQIAAWAERHYVLEKAETKVAATIALREVDGDGDRAAELARMLSGQKHAVALEHARTLLASATRGLGA